MRRTPSPAKPAELTWLLYTSAFLAAALMLSFLENVLLASELAVLPGAKLGLANAAVLLAAHICGFPSAVAVSVMRAVLSFLLFGNYVSFLYSAAGAALSLCALAAIMRCRALSFLGKSAVCAVFYNIGQTLCAVMMLGNAALSLISYMIIAGAICGSLTGIVLNLIYPALYRAVKPKERSVRIS